ncbi:hypothetical protein L3Q82_024586 [Scortum barcoo]|uniref:Uncharacterized protein n=1 Tax=Scortum barcoo TaxID=214431 RepID=A0ACB8WQ87_9TELE|nr:hypothetical protein L3Q82_024586 [Scortum barcoo]
MRWWLVVASLWLLVALTVPDAQAKNKPHNQDAGARRGKRRRDGQGHGRAKAGRTRPLKIRLIPGPSIPVGLGENKGNAVLLQPYKNILKQHSTYNVIPGKQGQCVYQGLTMFDQAVWSPKPCVTCLCTGGRVVCDEITCPITHCHFPFTPAGECCPVCMEPVPNDSSEYGKGMTPLTQEEIQGILWREEEEHREEEERLRKKDEARKKRRKERKEQAERQRKIVEERRREEEEALRLQVEKEEKEWRRQMEEIERKRQEEEERRRQEEEDRQRKRAEEREREMKLEEERRRQEEILREELLSLVEVEEEEQLEAKEERLEEAEERLEEAEKRLEEAEERLEEAEEEEEVWLRGDVFQMLPKEPEEPEEPDLLPAPIPRPPAATNEELKEIEEEVEEGEEREVVIVNRGGLPPGCDISDVTVTCENTKLTYFPPLSIPELKSLSLEGNNISSIPAEAFNGIPNLEWINLKKNKLTSAGIDAKAFKGLKMLRRLYLDGNLLDAVPSDLPPTLQELKISENRLREIQENSFQDLNSLVILELEGNLLSEGNVDPLAFAPLAQLSYLRLGRNFFRTIPQGLPKSLLELYLENNLIEEISETAFNQTHNLNLVSLRHNKLDETRIAPMAWFNHRNLESIDLSHNDLYLVPSYLPRSLIHLVLVGNKIERIPGYVFAHMDPGLEYLYLSYNKLDGEGTEPESFFGSYNSMVELCLDNNQLITVPSGINEMTNLHFLRLNNNKIRSIPDEGICDPNQSGESTLVALRLENNYIDPQKIGILHALPGYSFTDQSSNKTMRIFLLLCLLALGNAKPYQPINVMDFMKNYDIMMADSDEDDDDDDDDDDYVDENCPAGCHCSPRVVQCSDQGQIAVPEKIPEDTVILDLQNNDITEIKEDDFKGLHRLHGLFLINNKISKIHPKAFRNMDHLRLLYLSYNLLTDIPANLPPNVIELRFHENKINTIQKDAFKGLRKLHVLELGANPLTNSGIQLGAFNGLSTLYVGMAEAKLTAVPKDLPSSMTELSLDYNKISKVEVEDFIRYKNLQRLGLGFNQIKFVENGTLVSIPNIREIHLDNNRLRKVPPGLNSLRYLQVIYLHGNKISSVGVNDFCPIRPSVKKNLYTGISLFANPVKYWEIQPATFRCVTGRRGVQLGNFRK